MLTLVKRMTYLAALCMPLLAFAADAPSPENEQKAKFEFVRSSGALSLVSARVEINGRRVAELGKGETSHVFIEPGQTIIKIDSSYSPGQFSVSFTTEKGAEYRFEIFDGVAKVDAERVFGSPPKVADGKVLESGGVLKATLASVQPPKTIKPEPAATIKLEKPDSVPVPVPTEKPASVPVIEKPALTIEEQLKALKRLYDQELISKEAYLEKQRKILEGLR